MFVVASSLAAATLGFEIDEDDSAKVRSVM